MKCPQCKADNEIDELNRCWKCGKDLSTTAARSMQGSVACSELLGRLREIRDNAHKKVKHLRQQMRGVAALQKATAAAEMADQMLIAAEPESFQPFFETLGHKDALVDLEREERHNVGTEGRSEAQPSKDASL